MKLFNFDRVVCISPHPDDVEYSMSGLISKYPDTKFWVLCLTVGTSTDSTSYSTRIDEAKKFWSGFTDKFDTIVTFIGPLFNSFENASAAEWMTLLDKKINDIKPDAIIGPSSVDSHQEHKFTNDLMSGLVRNKPISLIEYKSPSTLHNWVPNYFVSVDNFFILKCKLLQAFDSQMDSLYFNEKCLESFHTDYSLLKRGVDKIEQFKICLLHDTEN